MIGRCFWGRWGWLCGSGAISRSIATAEKAEQMARKRGFTELADRNAELLKNIGRPTASGNGNT